MKCLIVGSGSCLYDLFCSENPSFNAHVSKEQWMSSGNIPFILFYFYRMTSLTFQNILTIRGVVK